MYKLIQIVEYVDKFKWVILKGKQARKNKGYHLKFKRKLIIQPLNAYYDEMSRSKNCL